MDEDRVAYKFDNKQLFIPGLMVKWIQKDKGL